MFGGGPRIRIGSIGRHPLYIDLIGFGLIVLWVIRAYPAQAAISLLVGIFFSVLVHEAGHAWAARRYTGRPATIVIGIGGMTYFERPRQPYQSLVISLAGPGAGFVLGAAAWGLSLAVADHHAIWPLWDFDTGGSVWMRTLQTIIWVSTLWGVVNLVPAYPLDGGQALRALLVVLGMKRPNAHRLTRRLALSIALPVGIWAYLGGAIVVAVICAWIFVSNLLESHREGW